MFLPEIIFPKKEFQIRGFESLYLAPSLIFLGTARGPFSQSFFHFFVVVQPWWPTCLLTAANPRPPLPLPLS